MSEELGLKYQKQERATYLKERFKRAECKIRKKSKNAGDTDEEDSKDTPYISGFTHPEKCGFSAQNASCGNLNNALMARPTVFA